MCSRGPNDCNTDVEPSFLQDHEFIPTRMKTIQANKPVANPQQFTKVNSNPLLISAQKQMLKVEEIKKAKEIVQVKRTQLHWCGCIDT